MPELPEVETVCRQLHRRLAGKRIVGVEMWKTGREFLGGDQFVKAVINRRIEKVYRRAKAIIFHFGDGAMVGHLKMTGKFIFVRDGYRQEKHDRMLFVLDDGTRVVWSDVRQFGYLKVFNVTELEQVLAKYGPEPLETSVSDLADRLLKPKTRMLKVALLDQATIAGIGNIYVDEACHRAGVLPTRRLGSLSGDERERVATSAQEVLKASLAQKGTSANDYVDTEGKQGGFLSLLRVYQRTGKPCLTCTSPIEKVVVGGRGTHFCSNCQC
ncbi:MAG: bifunctional DNA-formamidopyrimidine glycosylase/DNA-(apurinic or apyrimidinic site) lyase [Patescibacteria group bacterium]